MSYYFVNFPGTHRFALSIRTNSSSATFPARKVFQQRPLTVRRGKSRAPPHLTPDRRPMRFYSVKVPDAHIVSFFICQSNSSATPITCTQGVIHQGQGELIPCSRARELPLASEMVEVT